ncbi:MAG: CDP-alcohol phosphatidyltransferase family protein [Intrasporangium sp.]|uniref:CDP-alcohol phosphatidyltransferase family protein n=1 Tax=Intrasporangium sp. TaxID=1925024 RepID=UPI002648E6BC|nr:CDP-alcohol phosphatidyltransferase family protein [Intrasporangium sp.]MDN5794474.1 CDP-alcohol phosphatidyltransferase family protein [Intrasporangium sp.]
MTHDPTDDRPTLATLRSVAQPPEHIARYNAEHWAGALYIRHLSIYVTRLLLPTHITPNGVTWLMIVVGVLGALALPLPGLWGPVVAVVAMQVQILLDCSDGEVARWRQRFSPAGIYLDRVGHYLTEATIPFALGLRADAWSWREPLDVGGWTVLGLIVSVLVLLNKAFTDLVHVARAKTGRPMLEDVAATARSRVSGMAAVRRAFGYVPIFRAFIALEASLLALSAGIVDVVRGDLAGTQWLVVILVPLALITAAGHLLGVLTSSRLD